jgi:hypothetical protein
MKAIHAMLAPVAELSFAEEHRGPMLTPRKRDDRVTMA